MLALSSTSRGSRAVAVSSVVSGSPRSIYMRRRLVYHRISSLAGAWGEGLLRGHQSIPSWRLPYLAVTHMTTTRSDCGEYRRHSDTRKRWPVRFCLRTSLRAAKYLPPSSLNFKEGSSLCCTDASTTPKSASLQSYCFAKALASASSADLTVAPSISLPSLSFEQCLLCHNDDRDAELQLKTNRLALSLSTSLSEQQRQDAVPWSSKVEPLSSPAKPKQGAW